MSNIQYGLISRVDSDTIEKTIDLICGQFPGEIINVCEIGLYNGRTSAGLYEYVTSKQYGSVSAVKNEIPKINNFKCNYTGVESFILGEKMVFFPEDGTLINGNSIEIYNRIPDNSQHFILIDGNHSFPYVVADFFCYKDKIKKSGYLCFHDASPQTQWKGWQHTGDKDDPDMAIAVMKALEKIGLVGENHNREWLGFELFFHEWDANDEGGGVIIFQKKY